MLVSRTNLKKFGKVFTSKFAGTGPSSYKKGFAAKHNGMAPIIIIIMFMKG